MHSSQHQPKWERYRVGGGKGERESGKAGDRGGEGGREWEREGRAEGRTNEKQCRKRGQAEQRQKKAQLAGRGKAKQHKARQLTSFKFTQTDTAIDIICYRLRARRRAARG